MPASEKKKLDANCMACNDRAMTGAPHRVQSHRDKCDIAGHRRPHKDLPTAHSPSDLEKKIRMLERRLESMRSKQIMSASSCFLSSQQRFLLGAVG